MSAAPAPRPTGTPPAGPEPPRIPGGHPMAQAPAQHVSTAPPRRGVGKPPNPRKPRLVRHVNGGGLGDLFAIFPDLPRAPIESHAKSHRQTRPAPRSLPHF